MNQKQLTYLCVIARCGSIRDASQELQKNPSTLTRMLRKLEESLGAAIFLRTAEGLKPTPEGEQILAAAEEILSGYEKINTWAGVQAAHSWTENELRYLMTIREHRNISRAAQELYLSQPSLSQMLQELEADFGKPVFVRARDGVAETAFGTELLDRLEDIRGIYRKLRLVLDEFRQMSRGELTFGIPLNLGTYLLPLILPRFCEKYPGIAIHVRENNTSELEKMLIAKKIEFCIRHDYEEQNTEMEYEVFSDDPFFLIVPGTMKAELALPKDRPLTAADLQVLKSAPFIMVAGRQKLRLVVDDILDRICICPNIRCTTRSMETAKRLVAAGMGVTFLPWSYLTLYSGTEGLESYPLAEELHASWKLVAAYYSKNQISRSSKEFLRMLKESLG